MVLAAREKYCFAPPAPLLLLWIVPLLLLRGAMAIIGVLPLSGPAIGARHPLHEVYDPPNARHGGGRPGGDDDVPRRGGRRAVDEPCGQGHPALRGLDLDARRGGGDGEAGDAGEDRGGGRGDSRGDGHDVRREVGGRWGWRLGGHSSHCRGNPREVRPNHRSMRAADMRRAGSSSAARASAKYRKPKLSSEKGSSITPFQTPYDVRQQSIGRAIL